MAKIKDILLLDIVLFILSFAFGLEGAITVFILEVFLTIGIIVQIKK